MQVSTATAAFLQQRRLRRRAASTIDQYHYQLEGLWLPWRARRGLPDELSAVTHEELEDYFRYLASEHINGRTGQLGLSAETINSSWRALRTFWHFAASQRWLSDSQREHFRGGLARLPHQPPAPPTVAEHAALRDALLAACALLDNPEERSRNQALLRLLSDGLRVSELVGLYDSHVDLRERCARINRADGRSVILGWGYDTALALRAYRCARTGEYGGPLLRSTHGQQAGQALSISAARRIIQHLARLANVAAPLRLLTCNQRRRVVWVN